MIFACIEDGKLKRRN